MIERIVKVFGLTLIFIFSAISIFFSINLREFPPGHTYRKLFSYTSLFEDRFYDIRMLKTLDPKAVDKRLVLAEIDDESIKKIGKWPLPRDNWAKMMDKLNTFGAKVIAYDVFFSEESNSCGGVTPEQKMADAIKRFQSVPGNKVVLPYSLSQYPHEDTFKEMPETLYNFIMDSKIEGENNLDPRFVETKVFPLPILTETEAAIAHIEATADNDGIFRHYPVVGNVDTLYFPSFALSSYEHFTGDKPHFEYGGDGTPILKLKTGTLTLSQRGEAKVRWLGNQNSFPRVPIWKIIAADDNDPEMKQIFDGRAVFIGSTAFGAHDLRHTPVDSMMPGIYFHMNMTHMLLEGKFFKNLDESTKFSWLILIVGTIIILLVQFLAHPLLDLISVLGITVGLYFIDTYYLLPKGYEIKLFFCLFSVGACYSWNTFLNFYLANKDKAFLKNAFGNYISPELIDEMYSTGVAPELGGDCGIRTAFFTDIQSFSTFSEKLSATQLVELLNEYLTAMTDILLDENGTLDKYEGDAIIAFFGAPMPLEDHARRACMVAHRMQESLLELRKKWVSEGDKWPQIVHEMRMRIGINTGEIVTGNMGSASRMNYTMMGDSVNLAARLEEGAKQYGIFTQISTDTMEAAGDEFLYRELDTIKVVGKSIPVTTYDLLGLKETAPQYLKDLSIKFKQAIDLYKSQQWDQAIALFEETLELEYQRFPGLKGKKTNPSEIYLERCKQFKELPPPPEWDGVYTLTSK